MTQLTGSTSRVELGRRVFVQSPGLVGNVDLLEPSLLGTRGAEQRATPELAAALERQGFTTMHSLEVRATPVVGPAPPTMRGPDDRPQLVLEVPYIAPDQPQVVLLADEEGVVTWHYPQPTAPANVVRFAIPADTVSPTGDVPSASERGLVSVIGKKLLSVLVFPIVEAGVQMIAEALAKRWEDANRPSRLRMFTGPDDSAAVNLVRDDGWHRLAQGRALLFIHGTFSTSQGGFGGLDRDAWGRLTHRYDGRVFAFDHPSLSADPLQNVNALRGLIPPDVQLDVDIVAHSRGGLVARALACAAAEHSIPVNVSKIVHVGVPNAGTALADVKHHAQFVDRISTLLNLAPDGPPSMVADVLDGVLTLVKIIGCNGVGGLPGLSAMNPSADWLTSLGQRPVSPHLAYGIDSEYEPVGGLLKLTRLQDGVVDLVFQRAANDMVVPTGGVYDAGAAVGFPIPPERRLGFDNTRGVWHCSYFGQRQTTDALLGWLTGGDATGDGVL